MTDSANLMQRWDPEYSIVDFKLFQRAVAVVALGWIAIIYGPFRHIFFFDSGAITSKRYYSDHSLQISVFRFYSSDIFVETAFWVLIYCLGTVALRGYAPLHGAISYVLFHSFVYRFHYFHVGTEFVIINALFCSMLCRKATSASVKGWSLYLLRWNLAIIILFAGVSKIQDPNWILGQQLIDLMKTEVALMTPCGQMFEMRLAIQALSVAVPFVELIGGILLLFGCHLNSTLWTLRFLFLGIAISMQTNFFADAMLAALLLPSTTLKASASSTLPQTEEKRSS